MRQVQTLAEFRMCDELMTALVRFQVHACTHAWHQKDDRRSHLVDASLMRSFPTPEIPCDASQGSKLWGIGWRSLG